MEMPQIKKSPCLCLRKVLDNKMNLRINLTILDFPIMFKVFRGNNLLIFYRYKISYALTNAENAEDRTNFIVFFPLLIYKVPLYHER